MMAWGDECSRWDDSVDYANLAAFKSLSEIFWFAEHCAYHSTIDLESTLILHRAVTQQRDEF
jgi:hypothetical protein